MAVLCASAHNTVFGSKHSAICALAVYLLHLTRPSVNILATISALFGIEASIWALRLKSILKCIHIISCIHNGKWQCFHPLSML